MILRRLRVEHFRRHNVPVDIAFDERLTIVAGLNEAGKTTLFEALQYAFFRRSGATGKDIEALVPWGCPGLSPAVTVDFEHQGAEYQLVKNWGKRGGTQLAKRNASGLFVPDMADDADDFLATVFAGQPSKQGQFSNFTGQHMGLAYLLFVPQGRVPIAGATKDIGLHTDAQARLTEILGAASQSPEAARLGKAIETACDKVFTSKGQRRVGAPAAQVATEIGKLELRVDEMRRQLASFESAADELDAARVALQAAALAANQARGAVEASRPRYQTAVDLRAALTAATADLQQAKQHYENLIEESRQRENARHKLEELRPEREARAAAVVASETAHSQTEREHSEAVRALRVATAPDPELERLERELRAARAAAELRHEAGLLQQQVAGAEALAQRLGEIDTARKLEIPITQAELDRLRSLVETERGLLIRLEAAQTLLTLMPERPVTIAWHSGDSNERKKLEAGQRFEIAADGRFLIELAGVARIEISRPVNDVGKLRAELSGCQKFLAELQRDLGTRDPAELQKRLNEQHDRARERARLQVQLEELLNEKTVESQKKLLSELQASLASAADALGVTELDALLSEHRRASARSVERLNAAIESLTEGLTKLRGDLVTAQKAQSATDEEWRRLEAMAGLLPGGESPTDPETHLQAAYAKRFEAERKVAEARAAFAPYHSDEEPLEELKRLQDLANDAMRNEVELKARVAGLEQDLADGYAEAPASKLTELEEELERLRSKLADEEVTEAALHLLHTFVTEAEARRVENFAQPLLDCVAPWFAEVTGNELLRLNLSVDNEVNGLRLAGVDHEVRFDELSQGTCDQLALLIRLAFASLLTQPQRLGPMPVLLDDPLVHADWERRPRFGKILEDVSSTAQVIVFTCRPEDYSGTSGQVVTLGEAVRLRAGAA